MAKKLELTFEPEPWERQNGESDKAYRAFSHYRDLKEKRNLTGAASLYFENPPGPNGELQATRAQINQIEKWSRAHSWVKRVEAWERMLDEQTVQAQINARQEMNNRYIKAAQKMTRLATLSLDQHLKDAEREQNPVVLDPEAARKMLESAQRLEGLAMGSPTKIVEQQNTGPGGAVGEDLTPAQHREARVVDIDALSEEENLALAKSLRKMLGKAEPGTATMKPQTELKPGDTDLMGD